MCGINGLIRAKAGALERMNSALQHRGPDFAGHYTDERISLGHTLLSIRGDVDESVQPYTAPSSKWVLLFNGQIYNTQQLKKLLPNAYQSENLDTALLFALIESKGWDFISYVHGMFAIALYNKEEGVVKLYRDPSGQKNIYYAADTALFIFSSEIRGIQAAEAVTLETNHHALFIAGTLGYIPGRQTLYTSIFKLAPSEVLSYDLQSNTYSIQLFESHANNYFPESIPKAFEMLVEEHLQGNVEIALNLSGGLDSSLLLHEIVKTGRRIKTYSTSFEGGVGDLNEDAELAARLSKEYGVEHRPIRLTKEEYLSAFIDSYSIIEEPNFNISAPIYLLTAMREGSNGDRNRVVFSGDGGDELFGGYSYYTRNYRDDKLLKTYGSLVFNMVRNVRNGTQHLDFRNPSDRWFFYKFFRENYVQDPHFSVSRYVQESSQPFLNEYAQHDASVYRTTLMDRFTWLSNENFIRSDKIYMSQSMEMRCPLAYHPFREFIDSRLSAGDYVSENENKIALRRWYEGVLPEYITHRTKKTGWRAPVSVWYDDSFKELFVSLVRTAKSSSQGLIDWSAIERKIIGSDTWPGKQVHFYVALAALGARQGIKL